MNSDDSDVDDDGFDFEREDAISAMLKWFVNQFEEPQRQTPTDHEGKFLYFWGGPFDANEVLRSEFGKRYPSEWIDIALDEIEADEIYEWAPTIDGDFHEHFGHDSDDADGGSTVAGILRRLTEVERRLDEIPARSPRLGHNNPPEDIGLPPYTEEERALVKGAIRTAREQLQATAPDVARLRSAQETMRQVAAKMLSWCAGKADLAIDEFIKQAVKSATWGGTFYLLLHVSDELGHLLMRLPSLSH